MATTPKVGSGHIERIRQEHGLFTPEPTPDPDHARGEINRLRTQEKSAQLPSVMEEEPQDKVLSVQSKPEAATVQDDVAEDDGDDEQSAATSTQIEAVQRVQACQPRQHRKILGLGRRDPDARKEKENVINGFRKQGCSVHPDYNPAPDADKAFKSK